MDDLDQVNPVINICSDQLPVPEMRRSLQSTGRMPISADFRDCPSGEYHGKLTFYVVSLSKNRAWPRGLEAVAWLH